MPTQAANVTRISPSRHRASSDDYPSHIGLLNDFLRISYANGSSFATQFLYREFRARGQRVTVVGPDDPAARREDLPEHCVRLPALPFRMHPGVRLPMPTLQGLARVAEQRFDVLLGQTATELNDLGVWLRAVHHIPYLSVNTVYLRGVYDAVLPDALHHEPRAHELFRDGLIPFLERHSADVYNQTDGLVVLCRGLERYWRELGVTVPIHVIPRSIEPKIFDRPAADDPFPAGAARGGRLLCVCRHTREKDVERLIELFAAHVARRRADATLTLVGDGPDHDTFRARAAALGVSDRVFFAGELPVTALPAYYRHTDLFVYASLSETYGQVVSEALYCGAPVLAFADGLGVSDQVEDQLTGVLVAPGPDRTQADREFAERALALLAQPLRRRALSELAVSRTRARTDAGRIVNMYAAAFEHARWHCFTDTERRVRRSWVPASALARWACVQTAVAGFGYLRPEAVINRAGQRQPGWQELEVRPHAAPAAARTRASRRAGSASPAGW